MKKMWEKFLKYLRSKIHYILCYNRMLMVMLMILILMNIFKANYIVYLKKYNKLYEQNKKLIFFKNF